MARRGASASFATTHGFFLCFVVGLVWFGFLFVFRLRGLLQRACWGRESRHAETVKVFLQNGVPHDLPSEKGMTCEQMTRNEETLATIKEVSDGYEL